MYESTYHVGEEGHSDHAGDGHRGPSCSVEPRALLGGVAMAVSEQRLSLIRTRLWHRGNHGSDYLAKDVKKRTGVLLQVSGVDKEKEEKKPKFG